MIGYLRRLDAWEWLMHITAASPFVALLLNLFVFPSFWLDNSQPPIPLGVQIFFDCVFPAIGAFLIGGAILYLIEGACWWYRKYLPEVVKRELPSDTAKRQKIIQAQEKIAQLEKELGIG